MISIRIENFTKRFGQVTALSGLDLEIRPGELFFLLGPSGCGKTTLLRGIAGFSPPEEGAIYFDKDDVTHLAPHLRNAGMVFQSYALWPHMTVAENVAFGLRERKVAKAEIDTRVKEALAAVRMDQYAGRTPNQLSGGQQQRVALARALVVRPRCLLLDEPLSNLDARLRLEMRTEIRRVCKEHNLTAVYVTHDQKEALSIADRLAILEGGHILQVGTPLEVYRRPVCRTVAHFIGETDFIEGTVKEENSGGFVRVETAMGVFQGVAGDATAKMAKGAKVTLSVRPECWQISSQAGDELNRVRGRIGDSVYLGEVAQYAFHAESGGELKIYEMNPRHIGAGHVGEFFARVSPEDVVVLER